MGCLRCPLLCGCVCLLFDGGEGKDVSFLKKKRRKKKNSIFFFPPSQGFFGVGRGGAEKGVGRRTLPPPLLVRYPKEIKGGTKIDKLVQNLDFAPTLLDYAGVEIPDEMQGESFRDLASGKTEQWRDAVYYTYYEYPAIHMVKRHYGIATERYKLIHFYYDIDEWELYDLEKDPHEMHNVYNDPAYAEVREMMHDRLTALRQKYGDSDENDQRFLKEYLEAIKR